VLLDAVFQTRFVNLDRLVCLDLLVLVGGLVAAYRTVPDVSQPGDEMDWA
jgi:hypothetical protein